MEKQTFAKTPVVILVGESWFCVTRIVNMNLQQNSQLRETAVTSSTFSKIQSCTFLEIFYYKLISLYLQFGIYFFRQYDNKL